MPKLQFIAGLIDSLYRVMCGVNLTFVECALEDLIAKLSVPIRLVKLPS